MKILRKIGSLLRGLAFGLAVISCVPLAKAQTQYFTTVTNNDTYYWDTPVWNANGSGSNVGPYTNNWVPGNFARFYNGGGDTYTVVCSNAESMSGLFSDVGSVNLYITNSPTGGSLNVVTNSTLLLSQNGFKWYPQGFLTDAGQIYLELPITGPGCIQSSESGGLYLYASNSFSGGYVSSSSSTFIYFNNNNSFGTGQILFDNTTAYSILDNTGPTSVDITNAVQTFSTTTVNFIGNSCTFGSSWYLGGSSSTMGFRNNGVSGTVVTLGPISATSGTVTYSSANGTTFLLPGVNTYTGQTTVGILGGDSAITLEIGAAGSLASTVVSNSGTGSIIKLDGPNCLKTNVSLELPASPAAASINLNFTGTQSIGALYLGGVLQTGGTYGSSTSGATFQSATFTGNGVLSSPAAPSILTQPQPEAALTGGNATFSVSASGAATLNYQWLFAGTNTSGTNISGATSPSYEVTAAAAINAGNYYVIVTNGAGSVTSSIVTLTVLPTNAYTQTIAGDGPIAYWRLDETNGTIAKDCIGGYDGTYSNVTLGQPGYSLTDPDTCIGLPANTNSRGYVNVPNNAAFNFTDANSEFTMEAWAMFTNFSGVERLISTLGNGNGYAFGINGNSVMRFTEGGVQDADISTTNVLTMTTGVWYYFAVTCDGENYYYYLNGSPVGQVGIGGVGIPNDGVGFPATSPLAIGADPAAYTATAEQVYGNVDEVAIYNTLLTATQISNHFAARYSTLAQPVVAAPSASPATNYASLSSTLQANAAGILLSYQWYQSPSTSIAGATNSTYTISPLTNSASYFVQVTNPAGTSNSPSVSVTVLPIPTNAADLNLTNNLVVHLPFDNNYTDATGRGNNGTNVGATTFVSPGVVGASALHLFSDPTVQSYNYVNLGVRPDLQFGSNIDFSVSFWVRETNGSVITNLPFFADTVTGSGTGFDFSPFATSASSGGGWQWELGDVGAPSQFTPSLTASDVNLINDGNWHHLVFVAQRSADLTVYLDGVQADAEAINFLDSVNTGTNATIGQDATGAYAVTGAFDLDDLGVWTRTLSSLEVSGIYLGGISNSVSFANAAVAPPTGLSITNISGQLQISWNGMATLQATTNVTSAFTNVVTGTSPYIVPTPLNAQMFYRLSN